MVHDKNKNYRSLTAVLRDAGAALLACALAALFVSLGDWQLGKARAKEAAQARLDAGRTQAPVELGPALVADPTALHLHPVELRGRYDAAGQILIDNRVHQGRAGVHVLTPLVIEGGGADGLRVLVNRGWLEAPANHAARLAVPVPAGPVSLAGTAFVPSTRLFALAPDTAPAGGNARWQNLDLARYRSLSAAPVSPLVVLLTAEAAPADETAALADTDGLVRDWPRPDDRHERHRAYAYQWYGFAATSLAIWAFLAIRRGAPARREAAEAEAVAAPFPGATPSPQ